MKIAIVCSVILSLRAMAWGADADPFADSVVSYSPGTGANASFENSASVLGAPASYATVTFPPFHPADILSLGLNGTLIVKFDQPIVSDLSHPFGMDFIIFGNSFFVLSGSTINGAFTKPAQTIWVSQDNVIYYQLSTTRGADDLFPTEGDGNPNLPVNPALTLSDFNGKTTAAALALYGDSAGGTPFSISWARDTGGNAVNLASISYIKVVNTSSTAGNIDAFARVDPVPEPSAGLLALGGALLWAGRVARRKIKLAAAMGSN